MKKYFILTVMFSILVAGVVSVSGANGRGNKSHQKSLNKHPLSEMLEQDSKKQKEKYVPGEILVKVKKNSASASILSTLNQKGTNASGKDQSSVEKLLRRHHVDNIHPVFGRFKKELPKANGNAAKEKNLPKPFKGAAEREDMFRWYKIKLPKGIDEEELLIQLQADPDVEDAELNYEWQLSALPDTATDPGYVDQWYLENIRIREAWQFLEDNGINPGGSRDVVVAVIDTGVDYTHEDLVGNIWTNGGEISGNEIDDDNNGFVDDVHGCSVVSDSRSHSGDPIDLNGHGTHVAGIIGATGFNGNGGVGVAFNVQIMAIRSAQYSGALAIDDIAEGLIYATDNGADVINMSFSSQHRSQIVEDALSVAFSQAVLVAAAGNQAAKTEKLPNVPELPHYPAALPWVLGVMASTQNDNLAWNFSNYDSWFPTRIEYEALAPGVEIYSTLPNNQYAKWSGTSMATPIVSGIAALIRSVYPDHAVYSNRFIMGQIAGSRYYSGGDFNVIDAYSAVAESPIPEVYPFEDWIFEDDTISASNDGDGRVDAGETVYLAIELMNRWGLAEDLTVTVEARAPGAVMPDPYVTIVAGTETFDYGGIGPFNTVDNGLIYDDEGVIIGVENPFVFTVDPNCPNDHIAYFKLTIDYRNASDPNELNVYTRTGYLYMPVQRGRDIPTVISEDMELTADDYWLITGPVLVEQQATLTIGAGAQVQWGGIREDPYNPGPQTGSILVRGKLLVEGTQEQPASFFPSYLISGQTTNITVESPGSCNLSYTKIRNPNLTGINWIDHCYLDWDAYPSQINAGYISNTIFHKLWRDPLERWYPITPIHTADYDTCLFDASWQWPMDGSNLTNCTFLQDNEENFNEEAHPISITPPRQYSTFETCAKDTDGLYPANVFVNLRYINGANYVALPMEWPSVKTAELIASYYGGHVVSISSLEEEETVRNYLDTRAGMWWYDAGVDLILENISFCIGLTFDEDSGTYIWTDGSPVTYTNWMSGYPIDLPPQVEHDVIIAHEEHPVGDSIMYHQDWANVLAETSQRINGKLTSHTVFILRMPAGLSMGDLLGPVENGDLAAYVLANQGPESIDPVRYNAFLSQYWDPQIDHWMRIIAPANEHEMTCYLHNNFWGTDSTTLIDHAIWDYYDDFTSARIYYGTPPENGYPSTYPFVERVLLNGIDSETVPVFGAEPVSFQVMFNRDMDPNTQPFVTFGPITPYTDFKVNPIGDGWVDARTWEGSFNVTPMTGDGYHQMRISGAVAADDPWLVTGVDVGRFRFDVKTMGVEAMTLQASGGEGSIDLMWQQDDFELLAGYHLYRSDNPEGPFERLNDSLILTGNESYIDTDIIPAVPMYYKFTVVQTDMQESDFSNIASAAALDTVPPVLEHAPATTAPPSLGLRLTAIATDNVRISSVIIYFRPLGSFDDFQSLSMVNISGNEWSGSIPGSWIQPPGIEYYIVASDGISEVYDGTPAVPHQVNVQNIPSLISVTPNHGPVDGGTSVMLSGALFQDGASVFFGDVLATDITVLGPSQITCTSPPHFPAMVDIRVVNPDTTECIRLNAFSYEDTGVVVSLPQTSADYGTMVELDLSVSNINGLRAADIEIAFDASVLTASSVRTGTLTAGWAISDNLSVPGDISISLASPTTVTGNGSIARITFNVTGTPPASTPLTISSAVLNDGAIDISIDHGQFDVNGFFGITGKVNYFGGGSVPGTTLETMGAGVFSTSSEIDGSYVLSNLPTGSYILKPSKVNDVNEITAYDASLVLQSAAGLISLSQDQQIAADVNRNGSVTSMDASYILEKSVGLIDVPFPGAGVIWDFVPSEINYPLLNSDKVNQNFTGVLIGDVSGNWTYPGEQLMMMVLESMTLQTTVSLPDAVYLPQESVVVPVNLTFEPEAEITSLDIEIHYDAQAVDANSVIPGEMVALNEMVIASNIDIPGVIKIGLAGDSPMIYEGDVAFVKFDVISLDCNPQDLILVKASPNEGAIETQKINGSAALSSYRTDFSRDCFVDISDLILLAKEWLSTPVDSFMDVAPSPVGDNEINLLDFSELSNEWMN